MGSSSESYIALSEFFNEHKTLTARNIQSVTFHLLLILNFRIITITTAMADLFSNIINIIFIDYVSFFQQLFSTTITLVRVCLSLESI